MVFFNSRGESQKCPFLIAYCKLKKEPQAVKAQGSNLLSDSIYFVNNASARAIFRSLESLVIVVSTLPYTPSYA